MKKRKLFVLTPTPARKTLKSVEEKLMKEYEFEAKKNGFGGLSLFHQSFLKKSLRFACETMAGHVVPEKEEPDCGTNPRYPIDLCTPTCGHNKAIFVTREKIKAFLEE